MEPLRSLIIFPIWFKLISNFICIIKVSKQNIYMSAPEGRAAKQLVYINHITLHEGINFNNAICEQFCAIIFLKSWTKFVSLQFIVRTFRQIKSNETLAYWGTILWMSQSRYTKINSVHLDLLSPPQLLKTKMFFRLNYNLYCFWLICF